MIVGIDASRAFSEQKTGTENYSYQLIKSIAKLDSHHSYLLYTRKVGEEEVKKAFNWSNIPQNITIRNITFTRLWTQLGLASEVVFNPPDTLFIPAHTLPVLRSPKIKTVVTIHDLGYEFLPQYHQFPHKLYLNKSTEYAVAQASRLIAVSQSTKKDLIKKLNCPEGKIEVIYEGYDKSIYNLQCTMYKRNEVLRKYNLDKPFILFVGTLQPRKNIVRLIEAFSLIASSFKEPVELVIAGNKGWMYEEILAAPKKYRIENLVKFLGYTTEEDLPVLYSSTLCFCLPSLFEGFGLPVLEAMACGCPVLVSRTSSLPEVAGDAGIYVDPLNTQEIAKNLQSIISSNNLRLLKRKQSLEQAQKFSWEKCAEETIGLFERLI
ncbi:glycosyltransferase family 4 protein [Candidatus Microgenomates bacterium]|nr:glycosyltransferase family 4 protein [Candidatus Microgenomates bacterium]